MAYLVDADVLIRAKNLHYGLDFCPAFWDWLDRKSQAGSVLSIDKVRDEIEAGGDELVDWAKARRDLMFPPLGPETLPHLATVSAWVQSRSYSQAAVAAFLGRCLRFRLFLGDRGIGVAEQVFLLSHKDSVTGDG